MRAVAIILLCMALSACGADGSNGEQGPPGEPGPPGTAGKNGDPGKHGDRGPSGEMGSPGEQGGMGAMGTMGLPGERGPAGDAGPPGPHGDPGLQGPKGDKGDKGDQGDKGECACPAGNRTFGTMTIPAIDFPQSVPTDAWLDLDLDGYAGPVEITTGGSPMRITFRVGVRMSRTAVGGTTGQEAGARLYIVLDDVRESIPCAEYYFFGANGSIDEHTLPLLCTGVRQVAAGQHSVGFFMKYVGHIGFELSQGERVSPVGVEPPIFTVPSAQIEVEELR